MRFITTLLLLLFSFHLYSQTGTSDKSYLTILVVPYTNKEESVSSKIDSDELFRASVSQVNRAFEAKGFRTKDYSSIISLVDYTPEKLQNPQSEVFEAIKNARVDILVTLEIKLREFPEGEKQIQFRLQAVDIYSAENYANSVNVESTRRRYIDFLQAATESQLISQIESYVIQVENKLNDILTNGRTITIKFKPNKECPYNLSSMVDGTDIDLSAHIYNWLQSKTIKVYPPSGDEALMIIECKIPVLDASNKTVTPYTFRNDLKQFLLKTKVSGTGIVIQDLVINSVLEIILSSKT